MTTWGSEPVPEVLHRSNRWQNFPAICTPGIQCYIADPFSDLYKWTQNAFVVHVHRSNLIHNCWLKNTVPETGFPFIWRVKCWYESRNLLLCFKNIFRPVPWLKGKMVSKTPLAISVTMEGRKIRDIVAVQGTEKKKSHNSTCVSYSTGWIWPRPQKLKRIHSHHFSWPVSDDSRSDGVSIYPCCSDLLPSDGYLRDPINSLVPKQMLPDIFAFQRHARYSMEIWKKWELFSM